MGTELERRPSVALAAMHGRHKAAVALVALGPERAAEILSHMPPAEVEVLSVEMAELWGVDRATTEGVLDELAEGVDSKSGLMSGGIDYAREVLVHLVGPDRAEEILGGLAPAASSARSSSCAAPRRSRSAPSWPTRPPRPSRSCCPRCTPASAAACWRSCRELQTEVASRIAQMGETNPEVIADVDAGLRQKLSAISTQEFASPGGIDSLAEILNSAGRSAERTVIEGLATLDPALADEVRMRMFTFEDMAELEDREIQLILREVDQKDLVLALRGVGEELTDKILRNLSQRGAEMLREDMEVSPPQRRAVVEEAQGKVVAVVRRLEEDGTIILRGGGGDSEDELL